MATASPPAHARPFHSFTTPRLIIRSCLPSDAKQIQAIRSNPLNNPYGGVNEPDLPVEVQVQRLEAQQISTAKGENAWMVIILKNSLGDGDDAVEELKTDTGIMIGNTGFNSFPLQPSLADETQSVLVGDTGIMIDNRFARKGYALEALCAIVEYGFQELGCGMMSLGTSAVNVPFRSLMRTMGIGEGTLRATNEGEEACYLFDREKWDEAKKHMEGNGKWYL
ncbi:hypothetical protein M430DRAFT_35670 [Amorphotheca resinae ATCC 22711]|uniref:N-acetyltransferase domain-containing protein n=1 Tax=Amorphotheca resinae ATCC 22711 TaxID=857342 RepID=A0A2T3AXJ7_AMORE|nr:hypothetical protein M430DRAFT_35670 [Amorphotheca resinae ATCC 22711]PSS14773.1 hypothetical protein M430DRAFT_35670 [Amorphotheca resinae ATCC 22711]